MVLRRETLVIRAAHDLGMISDARYSELGQVRNAPVAHETPSRALSTRELSALFATCVRDRSILGVRDRAMLASMYAGGMRANELVHLGREDWALKPPALRIRGGASFAVRTVLLGPRAADALAGWVAMRGGAAGRLFVPMHRGGQVAGEYLTATGVRAMLRERARGAGIDQVTPHDLRHTAIAHLWRAGASLLTIMRVVGGASPWTLEQYCPVRVGRAKATGQTAYHTWERAEQVPDMLALLRRSRRH